MGFEIHLEILLWRTPNLGGSFAYEVEPNLASLMKWLFWLKNVCFFPYFSRFNCPLIFLTILFDCVKYKGLVENWINVGSLSVVDFTIFSFLMCYCRVWLNGSWFVIPNKILNFHDWIPCYHEPFHNGIINGSITFK